jgi:hypothetical protein
MAAQAYRDARQRANLFEGALRGAAGGSLVERLVGPEAHDGQPQGIDCQFIVLHVFAEYVRHAGRGLVPPAAQSASCSGDRR